MYSDPFRPQALPPLIPDPPKYCELCRTFHAPMAHMISEAWVPVQEPFMVPSGPPLLNQPENQRRWPLTDPWFDPWGNGGFVTPWNNWGEASGYISMGIWIFVIIMVLFAIIFGGPRY